MRPPLFLSLSGLCFLAGLALIVLGRTGPEIEGAMTTRVSDVRVASVEVVPAHTEMMFFARLGFRPVKVPVYDRVLLEVVGTPVVLSSMVWKRYSDRSQALHPGDILVACHVDDLRLSHPDTDEFIVSQVARDRADLKPCTWPAVATAKK